MQTITNLAIVGTFIIYWRQLGAMRGQLTAAQEASRSQNLLALIEYLQRPAFTEARRVLLSLEATAVSEWTPEQRLSAERAISGYDVVGILIRDGTVPKAQQTIIENWGYSIKKCHQIASPFLTLVRETRGSNYWDDFEWLARQIP